MPYYQLTGCTCRDYYRNIVKARPIKHEGGGQVDYQPLSLRYAGNMDANKTRN